jgi:EAL domain-containing protein (putative c-di-GMP-specific phosphodiesterase class I)
MDLPRVSGDVVIVRSTIELVHNIGLTVVAEGVEEEATLKILVDDGCDVAQGYFFSRPCPAQELTTWLNNSPFGAGLKSPR